MTNRIVSPLEAKLLIHCYCLVEPVPDHQAKATQEALERLRAEGMLVGDSEIQSLGYKTTSKGDAWVEEVLTTPIPTQTWEIKR